MASLKIWISAFRLRTLPLALSSIAMGTFLAVFVGNYNLSVFFLCITTTTLLQILSNLANDYGDSIHGADSKDRKGPQRAVQSGQISQKAMFQAVIISGILAFISGLILIIISIDSWQLFFTFLGLGLLSILAAVTYTAGKKPYGYAGLGDISVLIFFGLVGVLGTFYLHTHDFRYDMILPALSCGFFAVAVLNINNIRDIESDRKAGKMSIPVRIGRENAVLYHFAILFLGLLSAVIFVCFHFNHFIQLSFLIIIPLLLRNALAVRNKKNASELDPYLKQMALTTLLFVITFGIGQLIGMAW